MPRPGCLLVLAATLSLAACGGKGPGAPSPVEPGIPAGTALTFLSGETAEPVAGAAVTVAGRSFTSGATGEIVLAERVPLGNAMDVTANGFLERQTVLRSATVTRFTLWPSTSPTGLTEAISAAIVYTSSTCPFDAAQSGRSPLERLRPGVSQVAVAVSSEIAADPAAQAAVMAGVGTINTATQGRVTYFIGSQAGGEAATFTLVVDPQDTGCLVLRHAATTYPTFSPAGITGGKMVFCSLQAARDPLLVTHELGHTFGFGHSPDPADMMFCAGTLRRDFSPREALLMALMLQRSPGNRFPDDDRSATAAAARSRQIIQSLSPPPAWVMAPS